MGVITSSNIYKNKKGYTMKIILIIPTLLHGGAERVMSELANEWVKQTHKVIFVLLSENKNKAYILDDRINIIELGFKNSGKIKKIVSEVDTIFRLRAVLKNENPNFILSFMPKYNILTLLATLSLNINVYVSDRNNPKAKLPKFIELSRKILYKKSKGIIVQTTIAKGIMKKKLGHNNIEIIPNPVKYIELYPSIKREKIILNIGRMDLLKGQSYLLQIFSDLNLPDWTLVILGSGELLESLKKQAKELRISNQVIFQGNVSNIDEWLARSSIFASTSLSEGFPNALAEAMAAGLACVSFDCDTGPSELIENKKNGFLIPLKDIESFKESINYLVTNKSLRKKMGNEAIKIRTELKPEIISDKFLKFCSK